MLRDFGDGLLVIKGRWGPFLKQGKINAKLPKDRDIDSLTLEECQALIAAATPAKPAKKTAAKKASADSATPATEAKPAVKAAPAKKAVAKKTTTKKAAPKKPASKSSKTP